MSIFTACIWLENNDAEEMAKLYKETFTNVKEGRRSFYTTGKEVHGQEPGALMTLELKVEDLDLLLLNGGKHESLNPSISFSVCCENKNELQKIYDSLSKGGSVLMPLDKYDFSECYAWIADRFGVSWQLNVTQSPHKITPSMLFTREQAGRAKEAIEFFTGIFPNSKVIVEVPYTEEDPDTTGTLKYSSFLLDGQNFVAMDSSLGHAFGFNGALSLMVACKDQKEVDRYWEALTAGGGEPVQCGWLKDKFGISWQIVPEPFTDLIHSSDHEKVARMTEAMFGMQKLDLAALEKAYRG